MYGVRHKVADLALQSSIKLGSILIQGTLPEDDVFIDECMEAWRRGYAVPPFVDPKDFRVYVCE